MRTPPPNPETPPRRQTKALWRRLAVRYEWLVKRIVPRADIFFDTCISFVPQGPISVLELGSGTGFATERLLRHNPQARVTGLDFSAEMLAAARAKPSLKGVRFVEADLRGEWPHERFDVVFTSLCLHHLSRTDCREALKKAHATLGQRGCFINGDIFKPATLWEERLLRERWLASLHSQGLTRSEAAEMLAKRRRNMRCFDTLDDHRTALWSAGFRRVVCPWICEMAGVFVGFR